MQASRMRGDGRRLRYGVRGGGVGWIGVLVCWRARKGDGGGVVEG